MVNWSLRTPSSYSALFRANEAAIYADINANPGTTQTEVITRTGINSQIVYTIMDVMEKQVLLVKRQGLIASVRYWTAPDWASAVFAAIDAARTWIDTPANEGKQVSDMSTDLAINDAVAEAIAWILHYEGSAKMYEME